jgi:uncharacterized membrane protein
MARGNDFVLELAGASAALVNAVDKLAALKLEYDQGNYVATLDTAITLTERPTMAQITATVAVTGPAAVTLLAAGHGTNLTRTRR